MRTRSCFRARERATFCFRAIPFVLAGLSLALVQGSCTPLECGEGTREEGGQCLPTHPMVGGDAGAHCGGGTLLVGNECVPSQDLCGEFTSAEPVLDDAGVPTGAFVCVGKPSTGDEPPPPCPEDNPPGVICVSGWVRWLVDDEGNVLTTTIKDDTADASVLRVAVYDPLAYAADSSVSPLATAEVNPRTGTFMVPSVPVPSNGFIALAADDIDSAGADDFTFAGIPFAVGTEDLVEVTAVAISQQQASDWTEGVGGDTALAAAGCPAPTGGGERTLSTCGTWIGIFAAGSQDAPGAPVEGVAPAKAPAGALPEASTFYPGYDATDGLVFDDPAAGLVWSDGDGPHEWTGLLGMVFYPNASLGSYGGSCASGTDCEAMSCVFGTDLTGGAAPGALFVQYVFPKTGCEAQ